MNKNSSENHIIEQYNNYSKNLDQLNERLQEVTNSIYTQSTSLKNLNDLNDKRLEKEKELQQFYKLNEKELSKHKEFIEEINKNQNELVKIQEQIIKLEKKGTKITEKEKEKLKDLTENYKKIKEKLEESTPSLKLHNKYLQKQAELTRASIAAQEAYNKRVYEGENAITDLNEKWNQRTHALKKGFGTVKEGLNGIVQGTKNLTEPWLKAEKAVFSYAKSVGMSRATTQAMLTNTLKWSVENNIGRDFNKSTFELVEMQQKYSEVVGRNILLTDEQKKGMLAMDSIIGQSNMLDIANGLENFGLGMSDAADFVHKTFSDATKFGISANKLTNTIRENIKMAQNYSFKNGLSGLTNMAKKALQLKTDLSLVNGFLDKTSTVEGAITTGANLQVLGGTYAMGSDPLSMLYESLNDMEGLFDRAVGMVKGKVYYDEKTKNFDMGHMDRYMLKQAATQMGIDPAKLIDVAFRQASLSKIEEEAKKSKIANDPDMIELIKNVATWKNGTAMVNLNGKDVNVSDLKEEDKKELLQMQKTDSQNLTDMAISLRSVEESVTGVQKDAQNKQAKTVNSVMQDISNSILKNNEKLDYLSSVLSVINIISSGVTILNSILTTVVGMSIMGKGFGNLFRRGPGGKITGGFSRSGANKSGFFNYGVKKGDVSALRASKGKAVYRDSSSGTLLQKTSNGRYKDMTTGRFVKTPSNVSKISIGSVSKSIGGSMLKGGIAGASISLVSDVISGEFKKDKTKSLVNAAGPAVGAAVGSIFGPIGTMVGGFLGGVITDSINESTRKNQEKLRQNIAESYGQEIGSLFVGENALTGNYNEQELNTIANALTDKSITNKELSSDLLEKMRDNNDLIHLKNNNIDIDSSIKLATGGLLKGNSHSNGGMPILGSNISVEGGEYVVNKDATKRYLPFLEMINGNEYKMTPKEPLGTQFKVHDNSSSLSSNNGNMTINPISLNLSGTIKLDTGNKQLDITKELLNNPQLISALTNMISKQLNILDNGSYNKTNYLQKFS